MLSAFLEQSDAGWNEQEKLQRSMLADLPDSRAKMYTMVHILLVTIMHQELFANGDSLPLLVVGEKNGHLCAFARELDGRLLISVAPRLYLSLTSSRTKLPLGEDIWQDTLVHLPEHYGPVQLRNILAGDTTPVVRHNRTEKHRP